jgi:hypothetical protein
MIQKISNNSNLSDSFPRISYSKKLITAEYEKWFEALSQDYWKANASGHYGSVSDYMTDCCYFFTMTFSASHVHKEKLRLGIMNDDFSVELDAFQLIYTTLARSVFGSRWYKPAFIAKLPHAIVCVDFEGSRLSADIPAQPKNVHIHAIWLVHPKEIVKFRKVIGGVRFRLKVLNSIHADQVKFEPYLTQKAQAGKLGSYVAKVFIKSEKKPLGGELFRIYPNTNYGETPYRTIHRYRRTNKMLARLRAAAARNM